MLLGRSKPRQELLRFTTWNKAKIDLMRERHQHDLAGTFALGSRQFCILLGIGEDEGFLIFREIFDTDKNNLVDAFETMAAVTMLASMPVQEKIDFIHSLYDFNGSGDVTVDELTIMLRTVAVGCSKMDAQVIASDVETVSVWSDRAFQALDRSLEEEISKAEFDNFVMTHPEISNILQYWQGGVNQVIIPPGTKFEDPEFPANGTSLYVDVSSPPKGMVPPDSIQWLRSDEVLIEEASVHKLFAGGLMEGDIRQGQIANSWFVSALAILAGRPDLLKELFVPTGQESNGRYCVRFFKEGNWVYVYIDDLLPCNNLLRPLFTRPGQPGAFWACLVEKAYAKLHGKYSSFIKGNVEYALRDLTGGAVTKIVFEEGKSWTVVEKDALWSKMMVCAQQGVMGCKHRIFNTPSGTIAGHKLAGQGIIPGSSYAIATILESEGFRLVKIRNAYGSVEYNAGEWTDNSSKWDENIQVAKAAKFSRVADGTFWMSFDEFLSTFNTLYICLIPPKNWFVARRESAFVSKGGGCVNEKKWTKNNQYFLALIENTELQITLTQEDDKYHAATAVRGSGHSKYAIGLIVHEAEFENIHNAPKVVKIQQHACKAIVNPFLIQRDVSISLRLPAGTYVILPMTFKTEQPGKYWLTVHGSKPFELVDFTQMLNAVPAGKGSAELEQDIEELDPSTSSKAVEEDNEAVALAALGETLSELFAMVQVLIKKKKKLEKRIEVLQKEMDED